MTKKDTYIVRTRRAGSALTLPNGQRVHTLDRALFDRAVSAAENYIATKQPNQTSRPLPAPPPKREPSRG